MLLRTSIVLADIFTKILVLEVIGIAVTSTVVKFLASIQRFVESGTSCKGPTFSGFRQKSHRLGSLVLK